MATSMVPLKNCECIKTGKVDMMPASGRQSPWLEGMGQEARNRIDDLVQLLGSPNEASNVVQESEQSAKDLLEDNDIADAVVARIADPNSGKGSDQLCQWLYESYQAGDPDLQAVVLRFIPTLCGIYFSRTCGDIEEPLAGFEAVLLALYTEEAKARGGRPLLIHLPSLSHPSLYHTPAQTSHTSTGQVRHQYAEQLNAPLEPQIAVKSTKRAAIVGLALDLFWRRIAMMPPKSKLEFCQHARRWAVLGCSWGPQVDEIARLAMLPVLPVGPPLKEDKLPELGHALATGEPLAVSQAVFEQPPHHRSLESSKAALVDRTSSDVFTSSVGSLSFNSATSSVEHLEVEVEEFGVKLPLSLDLLRPIFKVLGHCLMATSSTGEVREAAISATRALYVRASEDLMPEAILASRSLVRLGGACVIDTQAVNERSSFTSPASTQIPSPNTEVLAQ